MKLVLAAFGKLKTPGMRQAADHYLKGIRRWADIEEVELRPVPLSDKSPETRRAAQEKEAAAVSEILERRFQGKAGLFLLDETGTSRKSTGWADMLKQWESQSVVVLVIGGSLGFSDSLRSRADGLLALGPQTLPHELARIVLLEQVFRGLSINNNHPYHNEG